MAMMKLACPEFNNGEYIPEKYSCNGLNISPPLLFENIPDETKSFVLMIEDYCTDSNVPWVHWLVFNIPSSIREFKENKVPFGAVEGLCNENSFGYKGPCLTDNKHQYFFKLFALDTILPIPPESDKNIVLNAMQGHIIEKCEMIGFYKDGKNDQNQL